jgi:predicted permease
LQREGQSADASFHALLRDLRHAGRALRASPGFTLVVALTLAIGIGSTTAVFTGVNSVLLEPLPYEAANRLVRVMMRVPPPSGAGPSRRMPVSLNGPQRAELVAAAEALTHVGASVEVFANWVGHEPRFQGARVAASTFEMLGTTPIVGRILALNDEAPGAVPAILLSEAAWRRHFDGDANALGATVTLESALGDPQPMTYSIVGVLPDAFAFPSRQAQFWTTFPPPLSGGDPGGAGGPLIARMADGVSIEAAAAEVTPIVREIRRCARDAPATTYELVRELDEMVSPVRRAMLMLSGAVACLLLIACSNVVNVMLARGVGRQREIAIRLSLGAGPADIARLVFAESLLLAALGGSAGVLLAGAGVRLFRALVTTSYRFDLGVSGSGSFPRSDAIGVDGTVLLFATVTSLVVATGLGLATSARHAWRAPVDLLRGAAGASAQGLGGVRHLRVGGAYAIAQVAVAMVLLVGGALLINSFVRLSRVESGYDAHQVLTFQVSLPVEDYGGLREREFAEALVERLRRVPGVEAAAYANQLPTVALKDTARLHRTDGATHPPMSGGADTRLVSRDYLEVMGIEVVSGRGLRAGDETNAPQVILLNEALARQEFPGVNPVGLPVYVGSSPAAWEIVGIVRNVRQFDLDREAEPQVFVDLRQWNDGLGPPIFPIGAYYAVRRGGEGPTAADLDRLAREIEPRAVVFNAAPMEQLVSRSVSRPRTYAVLVGVFSSVGLALALIGIYGVMSYTVSQRTREIGIRRAIGAERREIMALVLRESLTLTLSGIGVGLVLAAVGTRYLEGLLFGIASTDTPTYSAVALLFILVAAVASYVPARRATRIDPILALRQD